MSKIARKGPSFKKISSADLRRLAKIATADRKSFFNRHPDWASLYGDRYLFSALCQGAAMHYVSSEVGINDFDIYWFVAEHRRRRWHARRRKCYDFGHPKFGKSVDCPDFVGRRVDVMSRSLSVKPSRIDPMVAIHRYLSSRRTKTARLLAKKAVVILTPKQWFGRVAWPSEAD